MYRTDFWTLWEKARVGHFKRTASKHVYYLGWNRSPAQGGCMRQVLGPGALGRPGRIGWRGRREGGSGWGIHVYPWLIYVNVLQTQLQYCKVISLQEIKKKKWKKEKRKKMKRKKKYLGGMPLPSQCCMWDINNSILMWKKCAQISGCVTSCKPCIMTKNIKVDLQKWNMKCRFNISCRKLCTHIFICDT